MWEKVVLNLLSNALKYTLEGSVTVSLSGTAAGAVLRVSDTGVGIAPDELPRVFDRFHRIEGQGGRTLEGTGIGLALVEDLVTLHGGRVAAESKVGAGSAFTVTVPFGPQRAAAASPAGRGNGGATATQAETFVAEVLRWLPDPPPGDEATPAVDVAANDAAAGSSLGAGDASATNAVASAPIPSRG